MQRRPNVRTKDRVTTASRLSRPQSFSKDSLLLSSLEGISASRILCTSLSRAALAVSLAQQCPSAEITCCFQDVFLAEQARSEVAKSKAGASCRQVSIVCGTDFPSGPFDLACLPFLKNGEAELTRELMQQAFDRLEIGGRLIVSTDNPRDSWLHEQVQATFGKVVKQLHSHGMVYSVSKLKPLKRVRDFTAEFAFRDDGRLIKAVSRPGVFSHRELDVGARALLEATASDQAVRPGMRILDIGCGAGTVGIALALRAAGVHVHAVDSNPRALQCTMRGAEQNGLRIIDQLPKADARKTKTQTLIDPLKISEPITSTISTQLDDAGNVPQPGTFDLVLANPPYYSNWAIATIFVEAAARALKPNGRMYLVTKHSDWYLNNLPFVLSDIQTRDVRGYSIVTGRPRKPR